LKTARMFVLALLLAPASPVTAQRWTLPDSVRSQVDEVFSFVERDQPGCAMGLVQGGILAYGRGYGLANLDWGIPITTSTVFDIGSTSKQFTASALALLEMDGVLSLDDEVRRWIPELPDYGHPLTIRHLLNHTSGIRDYLTLLDLASFEWANVFDEFDGVEIITRQQALNFEPGSEYLYSNSGYLLLANIIRRASGRSIREFLEDRIFDPLGMANTSIWDESTEILSERATGYSPAGAGWAIDHAWNFVMGGDGQVITSVEDLMKWDANFYRPTVGGQGLLDRLHTRGVLNNGDTIDYALGLTLDRYRGLRRVQHGGSWAGFRAMLARYPDQETSVVVLCNRGDANPTRYADRVADAVLAEAFTEEPREAPATTVEREETQEVGLTEAQLQRWAGLYRHPDRSDYLRLAVADGRLGIQQGERFFALSPRSETHFVLSANGQPVVFSTEEGRGQVRSGNTVYRRVAPAQRSSGELEDYEGRYASRELEVVWEIRAEAGRLELHRPAYYPTPLMSGTDEEFEADGLGITFVREGGRVTGLRVFAGRVTGIVFEKEASDPRQR
jgi:CubicO group peptidase (beta-lactamase class C family)